MGLWVSYKVRLVLFCFLCHGTQSSCVLHGLAHGSVGQLQVRLVLFCFLCHGTQSSCVLHGLVHGSVGQLQVRLVLFPLSWDTVLLCPSWLSSWVCGSATSQACFVLFPLSWDTVLLRPSWLSSWVCGSATRSGLFCFLCCPLVSFLARLMGLWVNYKVRRLSCFFSFFVLVCPSWLNSRTYGSTARSGLFLVFGIMGHSLPASTLVSSWVYGSVTKWGLFCFLSFVYGSVTKWGLFCFLSFVSFVLLCSSWLSS